MIDGRGNHGQVNHVFSFILVTVVIVATIYLSITLMGVVEEKTCAAEISAAQRAINEIARSYDTVGTRQDVDVIAPCGTQYLCVFSQDWNGSVTKPTGVSPSIQAQLITASRAPEPKTNVFLTKDNTISELSAQPKFVTDEVLCVQVMAGHFTLHTEGRGRTISITKP